MEWQDGVLGFGSKITESELKKVESKLLLDEAHKLVEYLNGGKTYKDTSDITEHYNKLKRQTSDIESFVADGNLGDLAILPPHSDVKENTKDESIGNSKASKDNQESILNYDNTSNTFGTSKQRFCEII